MKLKKNGFVMRVAYGDNMLNALRVAFGRNILNALQPPELPKRVSVCALFWRFVKNCVLIPFGYLSFGCFILAIAVMFGITFVIVFFFARRPPVFANDDKGKTLVFYKKWPTLAGHRVYPAAIFLLALAAWALWLLGYAFVAWVSDPSVGVWFAITVLLALVVLLPVVLFCILFARFLKSEAWQLFKEFIKARKQKICPFVDIVE